MGWKIERNRAAKSRLYDPETGDSLNDATMKVIEDARKGCHRGRLDGRIPGAGKKLVTDDGKVLAETYQTLSKGDGFMQKLVTNVQNDSKLTKFTFESHWNDGRVTPMMIRNMRKLG